MRIAYFGTVGRMTLLPLESLAAAHEIAVVVRPWPRRPAWRRAAGAMARRIGWREKQPLEEWARARRIPCLTMSSGDDASVGRHLRRVAPDLICISTFRWILSPRILAIPPRGAINLHPSLLPRHRGPLPLFWIYHRDDRETGVTVHQATEQADAGGILGQASFPLPRGLPVDDLDRENAARGRDLMRDAVDRIQEGREEVRPQDESRATPAPPLRPGLSYVEFEAWEVERVWHFLAGLFPRYREPLKDGAGARVVYTGVAGYEARRQARPPGTVTPEGGSWRLHCRGGDVILSGAGEIHAPTNGGRRRP